MEEFIIVLQGGLNFVGHYLGTSFFTIMAAFAAMEPKSSVWILAGFGASISALRGEPRGFWDGFLNWLGGMFASVGLAVNVHLLTPEAEAILIGIASTEGLRAWRAAFTKWVGGVLLPRNVGGPNGL